MMEANREVTSILLIDDDEDDYLVIRRLLARAPEGEYKLQWLSDIGKAKEAIIGQTHDAYLVDYRLGAESGLELLLGLNIQERPQPFILLTGVGDRDVERRAMEMGAADYLVKGSFDSQLLARVIRYSLQRKMLESQRMQHLIEVNRSKDEFISLASHQLRTPATVVKQYVAMVLEGYAGEISETQRAMLAKAYEGNELQLQIVNDLLHVAAIDAGRVKLQKKVIQPVNLVRAALQDQQAKLAMRDQTAITDIPPKVTKLEADELKLRMVLDNLLDNASKYSDEGASIYVAVSDVKGVINITVRDTGVGIKQNEIDKLFQKFSRIPNRLSAEVGGSGLGLYWARQIVELHGGKIHVDTEEGKGSAFTIALPVGLQ